MRALTISFASLLFAAPAFADEALVIQSPPRHTTLGADAIAVLPVGDYGRVATFGVGALGRIELPVGQGFATGRAGVVFHQSDALAGEDASLLLVPVYAGYRYPLTPNGVYAAVELGITLAYVTVDTPFGRMSDSDSEIGLTLSAGIRRGALDLRAGLFAPDLDDAVGIMGSAGLDFAAF